MALPVSIREQKRLFRQSCRDLRFQLDPNQKAELDQKLVNEILRHPLYRNAETIFLFYPIKGEPDLLSLAEDAWQRGKTVAFPISHPEDRRLSFYAVDRLDQLKKGTYGIPEPPSEKQELKGSETTLCLVPGLAFDKKGYRLGYGGGYYDRFLTNFIGQTIAPVYSLLLMDQLPTEETDHPVAHIITEKGEKPLHVQKKEN